jgi:hypothetical protein
MENDVGNICENTNAIALDVEKLKIIVEKVISQTLNKREMIAAMCLQSILSNSSDKQFTQLPCVEYAVGFGDALLAELERTKK